LSVPLPKQGGDKGSHPVAQFLYIVLQQGKARPQGFRRLFGFASRALPSCSRDDPGHSLTFGSGVVVTHRAASTGCWHRRR